MCKLGDSKMTLSPNFKLSASLSSFPEPLIPGLPDDIAFNCLLRVPVNNHKSCRFVSKRWHSVFGTKEGFFSKRKEFCFHDPWLFVSAFDKCNGKFEWKVFDLENFCWHSIPAMPCNENVCPHGFSCVAMPHEGVMFVCGGEVSEVECRPLDMVFKYEVQSNKWTVVKRMITARTCFAIGVIDEMIYVAGGNSNNLSELNSSEVLDPRTGTWLPIADMAINMAAFDSAVLNGKLHVTEGWLWPFYVLPRGQIFDPETGNWESMAPGLREGWIGSNAVIDNRLFIVPEFERTVKVYDCVTDSWETVDGLPLPEKICRPFCVSCCENMIVVVGQDLDVALGHVRKQQQEDAPKQEGSTESVKFVVEWEVVDAPEMFMELTPSNAEVLFG